MKRVPYQTDQNSPEVKKYVEAMKKGMGKDKCMEKQFNLIIQETGERVVGINKFKDRILFYTETAIYQNSNNAKVDKVTIEREIALTPSQLKLSTVTDI